VDQLKNVLSLLPGSLILTEDEDILPHSIIQDTRKQNIISTNFKSKVVQNKIFECGDNKAN
jgi:hypothetical protein